MSLPRSTARADAGYRTLCAIASGGMGSVELAVHRDGSFERLFALKRLKPHLAAESEVRAMFLDEARIAGLLRHPNVVSVVSVGEDTSGPFLVMEYVDGISIAELLSNPDVHPLPLDLALRVLAQAAEGLHAVHELRDPSGEPLQIVHRDVSPQNILLGFDGIARVTDFGIAKALGRVSKTSTGILKGKLGYISPEQLRFEEIDRRADLFGLGIILFELISGQRLYRSRGEMDGPRRILHEPPPDLGEQRKDVTPELAELSFELLAKDKEARPATAKEVAHRLDAIIASIVADGSFTDTSEFVQRHFAARRQERAKTVSVALEKSKTVESATSAPRWSEDLAETKPRRLRAAVTIGVVGFITAVGVGLGAWQLRGSRSAAPSAEPPVATSGALTPPSAESGVTLSASAPEASEAAEPSSSKPETTSPRAPRAAVRAASPSSAKPKPQGKGGLHVWESY